MFQDNKVSWATHLEEELADLNFENFSSIDTYCNHIKSLADRLADVDAPLTNSRLGLKLTVGLPEAYARTVDIIQNQEPLPSFASCRSRLKLAERTIKNCLAKEGNSNNRSQAALLTNTDSHHNIDTNIVAFSASSHQISKGNKHKKSTSKVSRKSHNNNGQGTLPQSEPGPFNWQQQPWAAWAPWLAQWPNPPPCPYPASSWAPKNIAATTTGPRQSSPGVLGSCPQVYNVVAPSTRYTPTDIEAVMHALSFSQPDGNFYMDTNATSHMSADQGIFSSYFNSSIKHHNIVVGSGHLVPIVGHSSTMLPSPYPPFHLNNVLQAPKLIKNLIFVCKFTTDNSVSVAFDPLGFSVNDLQTGAKLMRCDSTGDLYPLVSNTPATPPVNNSAFATVSSDLWHTHLGHPGDAVLRSLSSKNFIDCNKACKTFCSSCPLEKHSKLPFYASMSHTTSTFFEPRSQFYVSYSNFISM